MKAIKILLALWSLITSSATGSENWIIEPKGNFEINLDIPGLGGLSAIEVNKSGNRFITISDKGKYFEGNILRDSNGNIINIRISKSGWLLNSSGNNLTGRNTDSESLTVYNEGFVISFESNHRIMLHKSLGAAGAFLPKHQDFKKFKSNKGIEAVAANSKGEIFAIPEEPPGNDVNFPIYKLTEEGWVVFAHFPTSGSFLVTEAIFLPDDDLLILERDYDWKSGFKMQLRLLNLNDNTVTGQTKLLRLNSGLHNHEGLSIWQDESKNFFITSISDNNFLPFIGTEIREFRLKKILKK